MPKKHANAGRSSSEANLARAALLSILAQRPELRASQLAAAVGFNAVTVKKWLATGANHKRVIHQGRPVAWLGGALVPLSTVTDEDTLVIALMALCRLKKIPLKWGPAELRAELAARGVEHLEVSADEHNPFALPAFAHPEQHAFAPAALAALGL